ncbi:MAG: signal peptide peptidase SppA [Elusimicrobia bacterium]|nr:signal peptide peptidase SppA [Elusimicrobiota bacterium]
MDELNPMGESHSSRKKNLAILLIALYGFSVLAAVVILWRGGLRTKESNGGASAISLLAKRKKEAVGWVSIHGPIFESQSGRIWDLGVQQWVHRLNALAEKPEIKAIVLDINSPGGSVGSVQELHDQIAKVRKQHKKPVVALFGDVAASGGYYIASACDKIVAHPGTLTGSIGVIFNVTNVQGILAKLGIKMDAIKSGKHKDIGSPTRPMTPEEKQILQGLIDDAYSQFLAAVSEGRRMPLEKVKPLADGRIYTGRQAQSMGLVDALGGAEEAVQLAAQLGGIKGKPKIVREVDALDQFRSFLETEFGRLYQVDGEAVKVALMEKMERWGQSSLEYRWVNSW